MGPQDTVVVGLDGGGDPLTDAALCFGALVRTCLPAPPREPLAFTASIDINTSNSSYCEPNIDQYCVVAATAISIAPQVVVSARGLRALVLVAAGTIDVQGSIDVSSDVVRTLPGAGADPATCVRGSLPVDAGGGAGGSFGGRGGNGQAIAGANATPAPELMAMPGLRGGCPGQAGSAPDDPIGGGTGGPGGGAVALVAQTIVLEGRINASGGGGRGGPRGPSGGGGGGSGGMIVLDTSSLAPDSQGAVFANGGGGGEGGGTASGGSAGVTVGLDGGVSTAPTERARGGINGANNQSGDGGDGSLGTELAGRDAVDPISETGGGGGGGGGGAGFIHAPGIAQISPPSRDP